MRLLYLFFLVFASSSSGAFVASLSSVLQSLSSSTTKTQQEDDRFKNDDDDHEARNSMAPNVPPSSFAMHYRWECRITEWQRKILGVWTSCVYIIYISCFCLRLYCVSIDPSSFHFLLSVPTLCLFSIFLLLKLVKQATSKHNQHTVLLK